MLKMINTNIQTQNKSITFSGRGKPVALEYVIEKRSKLLPQRVLE